MRYRVISADDHLQEGPHTWTARMSKSRWGDLIPQVRENGDGTESWYIAGERWTMALATVHGAMADRTMSPKRWEQVPEITYVPSKRVKAMEADGVDAQTLFGNVSGIWGSTFSNPLYKDAEFRLECIRAYNDYQVEEWSGPHPGRFITLAVMPLWDVNLAVAEVDRCKGRGIHGVSFALPQQFGYPHLGDPYWDPFWGAAEKAGLPVNLHISNFVPSLSYDKWDPLVKLSNNNTKNIMSNSHLMGAVLFSGILERFPTLKVVSAESGMGWVPYLLETADYQWELQKLYRHGMPLRPSEYFHRQCSVTFWYEVVAMRLRDVIGIDNMMWESDFPHNNCTWPNSQDFIRRGLEGLTAEERRKVLAGNAARLYHLDAS